MEKTAQGVAEWMVQEIKFTGTLHQEAAIEYVKTHFGEEFVFQSEKGHLGIEKSVLKEFRKLKDSQVFWQREEKCWTHKNEEK